MSLLSLLQLVSPALPVGAFSYSEGLEWLVQINKVSDDITLIDWIDAELLRGQVRIESASIPIMMYELEEWKTNQCDRARSNIYEMNSWLLALRDSSEVRSQQIQMGQSLMRLLYELDYK